MQTETDACSKCSKIIHGNSICCDKCNNWYDLKCAKIDESKFSYHKLNEYLQYICPTCIDSFCDKCNIPFKKSLNCICCDSCEKWLHLKCSGLTLVQLHNMKNDTWFCKSCRSIIFPFYSIDNSKLLKCLEITKPKYKLVKIPEFQTFNKNCQVCNKNVPQPYNSIPCRNCKCFVHKKCSKLTKKDIKEFHAGSFINWECDVCKKKNFLLLIPTTINDKCKCSVKTFKPLNGEMKLLLNLSKESENNHTHKIDQDFEDNAAIKPNFMKYILTN